MGLWGLSSRTSYPVRSSIKQTAKGRGVSMCLIRKTLISCGKGVVFLQSFWKRTVTVLLTLSRQPWTALFSSCFTSSRSFSTVQLNISLVYFWDNLLGQISSGNWPTQRHQNGVTDLQVFYSRSCMDRKMSRPMKIFWSIEQIVLW